MRISDWSSDVCSSDLSDHSSHFCFEQHTALHSGLFLPTGQYRNRVNAHRSSPIRCSTRLMKSASCLRAACRQVFAQSQARIGDRKSVVEGKSVSVRVDLGGRRIIKKHNTEKQPKTNTLTSSNK